MSSHVPKFQPGQVVTFLSEGDIAGGDVVEVGTADRTVKVAAAGSAKALGTAGFTVKAGDKVSVHLGSTVDTVVASAAIAVGDRVEAAGSGKVRVATTGRVLGIALTGGVADSVIEIVRA